MFENINVQKPSYEEAVSTFVPLTLNLSMIKVSLITPAPERCGLYVFEHFLWWFNLQMEEVASVK